MCFINEVIASSQSFSPLIAHCRIEYPTGYLINGFLYMVEYYAVIKQIKVPLLPLNGKI